MTPPEPAPQTSAEAADAAHLAVKAVDNLAAAEKVWRELEGRGVLTPYQRYDWLVGLDHAGGNAGARVAIVIVRRGPDAVALLPLQLVRRFGLTTARLLGTDQSNTDWMIIDKRFEPSASDLKAIFELASALCGGIDVLSLQNLPRAWDGVPNPLLRLPHDVAASNFYATEIGGTGKPFIDHRLAPKRRGDLKRSRRRMEEAMGRVELVRVADEPTLECVHAAFLEQRRTRFDEMGVTNVFEDELFRRFFHDVAVESFGAARPAIVVHALMGGGDVTATAWGTTVGDHYSLYINSTLSGDATKFSLMHILIADLMDDLIDMGIRTFDIGLGDFSYKTRWTEAEPVFNSVVPLTARGRLAASALAARSAAKRTIKQNPALWSAASAVRKLLFRLRSGK